jgi:MFS family permease
LVIAVNLVHGFAYACFFATVYIFVDENFPKDVRTSAQSLFNVLIFGLGPFLGNFLWGWLGDVLTHTEIVSGQSEKVIEFHKLFVVPVGFALLAATLLAIFFHPAQKEPVPEADAALA